MVFDRKDMQVAVYSLHVVQQNDLYVFMPYKRL